MPEFASYAALFASALLSATLLPFSSEAVLLGLLATEAGHPAALVAVATAGNVLGSLVNWAIGRFLSRFRDRRWFPTDAASYDRAVTWFRRYGVWTLLFAWVPFVGDPLTLVAGALRVDIRWFVPLVTIGKAARYLFLAGAFNWLSPG
jgi:membrane protein YqaA with SNARE-associated domain